MCGWSISTSRINHPNHLFSSFVKSLDGMNKSPAAKDHRPNHSDHSCSWPKSCHSGPPWSLQVISAQHVALSIYFQQGSLIFQNKCWQYKEWSSKGTWQEPGVPWNDMFTVVRISWSTSGSCSFNPPVSSLSTAWFVGFPTMDCDAPQFPIQKNNRPSTSSTHRL